MPVGVIRLGDDDADEAHGEAEPQAGENEARGMGSTIFMTSWRRVP